MPETKIIHGEDFHQLITSAVAEAVTRAIEATVARVTALETELATTKARLTDAEKRLEELENENRRSCLIISGVPETDAEKTDGLVMDVGRAAGLNLSADSLDRAHRLGRAEPGKTRPILVKFSTASARQKLYEKRKELTAEKVQAHPALTRSAMSKIYISECLSADNQRLLYVARQLRKKKQLWAAYTTNGRVKVKKCEADAAKTVRDLDELAEIVGAAALREFRPATAPPSARPQRGGDDATWQAADAVNSWVTLRRHEGPASERGHGGDGQRT